MSDDRDNSELDRRGFFRNGLAKLVGPLADMVEKRLDRVREAVRIPIDAMEPVAAENAPQAPARALRPPGALRGDAFLSACNGCGECVTACPAGSIYLAQEGDRCLPLIVPGSQPCFLCKPLACMKACRQGALVPTQPEDFRLGVARVDASLCLRAHGENCRQCVDHCKLGKNAIRLGGERCDEVRLPVVQPGCVGCGICEWRCPAYPKAITVAPAESIGAGDA